MAKLLIVDDDLAGCEPLTKLLRHAGHDVECLPDGKEALRSLLASPPDLLILDVFMPELDGPSLLEVLRSYLRLRSLPVIILTGLSDSPLVERACRMKVNSVLVKGKATPQDVLDAVRQELPRIPNR